MKRDNPTPRIPIGYTMVWSAVETLTRIAASLGVDAYVAIGYCESANTASQAVPPAELPGTTVLPLQLAEASQLPQATEPAGLLAPPADPEPQEAEPQSDSDERSREA